MNKVRRDSLRVLLSKLDELSPILDEAKEILQGVIDEEQDAFDNMPEGIQASDRGQKLQENVDDMQEVMDALDELDLQDLYSSIEEVIES